MGTTLAMLKAVGLPQTCETLSRLERREFGIMCHMTFKLIFAPEPDLFEQRLNRFMADLGEDVVIAQMQYSTVTLPNGEVMFSALVGFKKAEGWDE